MLHVMISRRLLSLSIHKKHRSHVLASSSSLSIIIKRCLSSQQPSWMNHIPKSIRPYAELSRLDKPIGTMLLFWPCVWGVSLATPMNQLPDPYLCASFALGALMMRSAGCTINDLWDQDFDKRVERTKNRPLARGAITTTQALVFLGAQLACGLGVLLTFNTYSIVLGLCSMPLVICYPLMKRFTYFPQAVLGMTFNWGVLVGWAAVHGSCAWSLVLPLYGSGICWTLVYDTLYGYQDRQDDLKIGVKSTSIYFGDAPQVILTSLAMCMMTGLVTTGYLSGLTTPYYMGITFVGGHMCWQIWTAQLNENVNLWNRFSSNAYIGGLIAASIIAGHFEYNTLVR